MPKIQVKDYELRGYWLTDVGQHVTGWVPAGEYERGPVVMVGGIGTVALCTESGFAWHVAACGCCAGDGLTHAG